MAEEVDEGGGGLGDHDEGDGGLGDHDPSHLGPWPHRIQRLSTLLFAVCAVAFLVLLLQYVHQQQSRRQAILDDAAATASRLSSLIAADLKQVEDAVRRLASGSPKQAEHVLEALENCAWARALTVLADDGKALRAVRPGGHARPVLEVPDSALLDSLRALANRPGWQDPSVEQHRLVVRFIRPFPGGLAAGDVDLDRLKGLVDRAEVGEAGYCFVLRADGRFVLAPLPEVALTGVTLSELTRQAGFLTEVAALPLPAGPGLVQTVDDAGKRFVAYQRIAPLDWTIFVVQSASDETTRSLIGRTLVGVDVSAAATLVFLVLALALRGWSGGTRHLWLSGVGVSIVLVTATVSLWGLVLGGLLQQSDDAWRLGDANAVERFKSRYLDYCRRSNLEEPTFVPTGVWVKTLEFTSANNVMITGIVWQKYPRKGIPRGVDFPEGVNVKTEEMFRRMEGDYEVVGWRFQGMMRQRFDYARYPFDTASVWIRVWPQVMRQNIIPVPDVDSYKLLRPAALPGMQDDFVLAGWTAISSAFEYRTHLYDTSFGLQGTAADARPELYFTIDMRRDFMHAFIVNLVPLFVIACLLFALVLTTTFDKERSDIYGFKPSGVLGTCSGLLFAALLAHTKLRTDFAAQAGIIYVEAFYFILYLFIVLVALNSFLAAARVEVSFLRFGDNVLPKLLFWPLVWLAVLALTLLYFH